MSLFLLLSIFLLCACVSAAPVAPVVKRANTASIDNGLTNDLIHFVNFAAAAYCPSGLDANFNCGPPCSALPGTKLFQNFDSSDMTIGFIALDPSRNTVVVSFRGTHDFENILTDGNFLFESFKPAADKGAKVHAGFQQAYETVQDLVRNNVSTLLTQNPGFTVTVTGHSLGGALAAIGGMDLLDAGVVTADKMKIFTYGEPRVGNQAWVDFFDGKGVQTFRVTNKDDPVPRIPPEFIGYKHHGQEFFIGDPGNKATTAVQCLETDENPDCSDSVLAPVLINRHLQYLNVFTGGCDKLVSI